jgi:hypothetical protein
MGGRVNQRKDRIMTHNEFNHLLSSIKALSRGQMRQLRQELDSELSRPEQPKKPPARTSSKGAKRAKTASPPAKKPMTKDEFHRHLIEIGLMSKLPDTAADFDDPDDEPIAIKGEPLSETVIRERR